MVRFFIPLWYNCCTEVEIKLGYSLFRRLNKMAAVIKGRRLLASVKL